MIFLGTLSLLIGFIDHFFNMSDSKKRGRRSYEELSSDLKAVKALVAQVSPSKKSKKESWVEQLDTSQMTLYNQLDTAIRLEIARNPVSPPDVLLELCGTVMKTLNTSQSVIDGLHEELAEVVTTRDKDGEIRHERLRQTMLNAKMSIPQCAIIEGMESMSKESLAQFCEFASYCLLNADFLTDFSKDLNPNHEVEELINQAFEERNVQLLKNAKNPPKRYDRANPRFASPPRPSIQPSNSSSSSSSASQGMQYGREAFYSGLVPAPQHQPGQ